MSFPATILSATTKLITGAQVFWKFEANNEKPKIYFANHSSHLDTVVIWSALEEALRKSTRPVAAMDYWGKGDLKKYIAKDILNALLIERKSEEGRFNPRDVIDAMINCIKDGYSLIIFPEGTRNTNGEISSFKSGLYYLYEECLLADFVPVYLENLNRILPKGEFIFIPLLSSVTFGEPLERIDGEEKEPFLNRAKENILELKKERDGC